MPSPKVEAIVLCLERTLREGHVWNCSVRGSGKSWIDPELITMTCTCGNTIDVNVNWIGGISALSKVVKCFSRTCNSDIKKRKHKPLRRFDFSE